MGSFVAGLDATVVNVALPSISHDLGGGLAGQQWVSNAYLLMLGSLILVAGSLADLYGERRVFSIGVGGFGVVSLVCAFAPSIGVLIAGRALQGVFGALLTPSALAVIIATFPAQERGMAIGTWTAWSGISFVIGPLVGGWLIGVASWRWIFAINVPFVLATLGLVAVAIPRPAARDKDVHLDLVGATLCVLGLAGPVLALIRQPSVGWGSPEVWAVGLAGLALFGAFLLWESRCTRPMLPLALFKRRNFAFGNLETFVMYGGMGTLFFFLTLFLQQVAGYSALQAGLATIPTTLIMFTFSRRVGRMADRYGPRFFMGAGPLIAAAGLALMLRVNADLDYWTDLFPALLVFSSGLVLTVAPLTATVLVRRRREQRRHRLGGQQRDRPRGQPRVRRGAGRRGGGAVQLRARLPAARPRHPRGGRGPPADARPRARHAGRGAGVGRGVPLRCRRGRDDGRARRRARPRRHPQPAP